MNINAFPHVLGRVCGNSLDDFNALIPEETLSVFGEIKTMNTNQLDLVDQIIEDLFNVMPKIAEPTIQNFLLNIKRDVHNGRRIKPSKFEKVKDSIPNDLYEKLLKYSQNRIQIGQLIEKGNQVYINDMSKVREGFAQLINEDKFKKGMLFSSEFLLGKIPNYMKTPSNKMRKRDFQIEAALMRYYTRMVAKTSPFSTYTHMSMGSLDDELQENAYKETLDYKSYIRINNLVFSYLRVLMEKNPEFYRHFLLRLNPSLTKEGEDFVFLTNNKNTESFQRIPAEPVLELFVELVSSHKKGIVFQTLIDQIIEGEYIDGGQEELDDYIQQLISFGFMEYNYGISGIDPDWNLKLIKKLKSIAQNNILVSDFILALEKISKLSTDYEEANLEVRKEILHKIHAILREACMVLHENAGLNPEERLPMEEYKKMSMQRYNEEMEKRKQEQEDGTENGKEKDDEANDIEQTSEQDEDENSFQHTHGTLFMFTPVKVIFEDSKALARTSFKEKPYKELINSIGSLMAILPRKSSYRVEIDYMEKFFIENYGLEGSVSLFEYYQQYYKESKIPREKYKKELEKRRRVMQDKALQKNKDSAGNKEEVEVALPELEFTFEKPNALVERRQFESEWEKEFKELMRHKIGNLSDCEQVNFSLKDVQLINQKTGHDIKPVKDESNAAFSQIFEEDGELKAVMTLPLGGNGKFFSRFLHMFDDQITADIVASNTEKMGDEIYAEDTDASYFNGNMHPPLMPYEIFAPGGHNALPEEKQIPITEIKIQWSKQKNRMVFVYGKTNKIINVFDLGFQTIIARSPLYQMLSVYEDARRPYFMMICHPIIELFSSDSEFGDAVRAFPRIVYENKWIIQRKNWAIPKAFLPEKTVEQTDWEYYLKVNEWRNSYNIPDEVFIKTGPRMNGEMPLGNDRKPQYINFNNPLTVELFGKALHKVFQYMTIDEMAPNSSQLRKINGKGYVTEYVTEWSQN